MVILLVSRLRLYIYSILILFLLSCDDSSTGPKNDCLGVSGGTAFIDDCGLCVEGTSDLVENYLKDECGICGGDGPSENYDCDGNCLVEIDCLGVCGGNAIIGNFDLCDYPCNASEGDANSNIFSAYAGEKDARIGGYEPWEFDIPGQDDVSTIFVPNYTDFCSVDEANCWYETNAGSFEKITISNYQSEKNNIKWIDLPHDNITELQYLLDELGNNILIDPNGDPNDPDNWEMGIVVFDGFGDLGCDIYVNELDGEYEGVISNANACNFDVQYDRNGDGRGEYNFGESQYGSYNPFGNLEINVCAEP